MMALRFQRVTSIVSPLLPRPDARGVTMRNTARQTRENRTITVDFRSEATCFQLLGDGKAFLECVLAFVMSLGCNCSGSENLLLVIQSPYGILCHHGNITGIPTRGVGTNPTQSASLYSGAGSACGDYGIHGPYLTEQVHTLQDQLHQASQHSSRPPSSDPPQHRQARRPRSQRSRGGQPGHPGHTHTLIPVEEVMRWWCSSQSSAPIAGRPYRERKPRH